MTNPEHLDGQASDEGITPEMMEAIRRGLAATSTWGITGGTHAGLDLYRRSEYELMSLEPKEGESDPSDQEAISLRWGQAALRPFLNQTVETAEDIEY